MHILSDEAYQSACSKHPARRHSTIGLLVSISLVAFCQSLGLGAARPADSTSIKTLWSDPPRDYSTGPLWVWNDMLTESQITGTLEDLASQKVKQVWVHPRPGLMTPYLGEDWFRMWRRAMADAQRLDMNVWIYDENSYPSGFAGGLVPEAMPESRGCGMDLQEVKQLDPATADVAAVYRLKDDRFENVTQRFRNGEHLPEARYLVATLRKAPTGGWFGGKYYVDLLQPGVTEKFVEITLGAYRRELGQHFGKRIPGVFTDEPNLNSAGGLNWTVDLARRFKQRWDYDLMDHLPALARPLGDWRRVRHDYHRFLLEQFIERWAKPNYEFCRKHGLEFTGHYWEHGWPGTSHGDDNMAMYAWHQRPAIDCLMNQYGEDTHSQFGNARMVRELASAANQMGCSRTLCETYGAGGWDLRFEDMKRIGDWLYVLGVNTLNEHLSYVTIRGARKRDHPLSFSYHEPWWEAYHTRAAYFTRLSLALSSGRQQNRVLLLEPTTTCWMYDGDSATRETLYRVGNAFQDMINRLEQAQAEYDLGCEDIMARHGSVVSEKDGRAKLVVGRCSYDLIVLPPGTENLETSTVRLLEDYVRTGGRLVCCGPPPALVDGRPSERAKQMAGATNWTRQEPDLAIQTIRAASEDGLVIRRAAADRGILFHHRRRLSDGELLFLVNTSIDVPSAGSVESKLHGVEQWDLQNGDIRRWTFEKTAQGVCTHFELPPCGSLLLFLSNESRKTAAVKKTAVTTIRPSGSPMARRIAPNVLTLDYVDVAVGKERLENAYFYKAQQFVFQKNGMDRNPWDNCVQFRDELIKKAFPAQSGFEAVYRFTIEDRVPEGLCVVVERPDLYSITCNGRPVQARPGQWWLDCSFGKIDLSEAAQVGENRLVLTASPMTMYHELEPAYLLGEFSLRPAESGFVVAPPKPLAAGSATWDHQGCPFYAAGVAYTERFRVAQPTGKYRIVLGDWRGSVAKVLVNGRLAGYIAERPWQYDVTRWIVPGDNTVEVVVIGTLRNTLGPHHNGPITGTAWPSMFWKAPETGPPPGKDYSTLGYGLFEPFALEEESP